MDLIPKKLSTEKIEVQKKLESSWIGTRTLRRGMFIFEWYEGEVREVDYAREYIQMTPSHLVSGMMVPEKVKRKELHTKDGAKYTTAINIKNAVRKFKINGYDVRVVDK